MKAILLAFCLIALFGVNSISYGQCCAAGSPVNTNSSLNTGGQNTLRISLSYVNSLSDTYYNGTEKLDKQYLKSFFNFSALDLSYGLTDNLRLTANIGYFYNKGQTFEANNYSRYAHGLSDMTFGLSYRTFRSEDKLFEIMQSAGVTLPVGQFNQEYDGIILPIDFQPSSGNDKFNLGLTFIKRFTQSRFSLASANSIEMSRFIVTENTLHKYGNLYNLSLIGIYAAAANINAMLQLRYEIRDRALTGPNTQNTTYTFINASGGLIAYLSPQIAYNVYRDFNLSLQFNYPVYKNVYSEQLTNKYSISVNLSKSINFGSDETVKAVSAADANLSMVSIKVMGNCDMCKARIEGVANESKNVESSEWDSETKNLKIYYKTVRPDVDNIEKLISEAGHDTEKYKAKDDVYKALPECCHYRK